jgi:hypothetical protein
MKLTSEVAREREIVDAVCECAGIEPAHSLSELWLNLRAHPFATDVSLAMILARTIVDLDRLEKTATECRRVRR